MFPSQNQVPITIYYVSMSVGEISPPKGIWGPRGVGVVGGGGGEGEGTYFSNNFYKTRTILPFDRK